MMCMQALTGTLFVYTLSIRLSLCYPSTFSDYGSAEIEGPKITEVMHRHKENTITCRVEPGLLNDETVVYWLANDSFIEDVFGDHRVETRESRLEDGYIQSDLVFKEHRKEDRFINFTCIAMNSAGTDMRYVTLLVSDPSHSPSASASRALALPPVFFASLLTFLSI